MSYNLRFFELNTGVFLKNDIYFRDSFEIISKTINAAMSFDEKLAKFHEENRLKHYVFDGFSPVQKDGIYKKGNIYTFRIRAFSEDFIEKIQHLLKKIQSNYMDIRIIEKKISKQYFVDKITNITPVIASFQDSNRKIYHWTLEKDGDIMRLYSAFQSNLEKKYESFFKEKLIPTQNFIQLLQIKNRKPQTVNYKGIRLFGNKFIIVPNEDNISQKLAFTALACGLGEKNSVGCGFCLSGDKKWY